MNERLNRFISLLKQIFELDKSDLDFGIYRVMNLRKAQIEEFLTERLPQMVQETLAPFAQGSKEEIRTKMKQIEDSVSEMGMTVDALPDTAQKKQQYLQLQKQLAEGADLAALETDVYSALYSFFNRYYEDGDFISKRRYKEGVYAIPYEGEEVKLYWANQDQYYIKTSENFKDYTFVFDGITVHFRLVDATTEQNNNKESKDSKRTFMLFTEDEENYPGLKTFEYNADAGEIVIRFVYDIPADKKRKYAEENYAAITQWLLSLRRAELNPLIAPIPTGKGKETTTLLEKHLKGYVAKNTFDYFIHKDLRGFLTRELDFFIESEVMHLEDLDTDSEARVETYLLKSRTVIDCRSRIQTIDSTDSFKIESLPEEHKLPDAVLPLLDIQRIFEELQQYKSEKRYFNISIVADKLLDILRTDGWYGLLIPVNHMEINSMAKLEAATDYAIMALKSYMDKFFKYEKERWEAPMLEYAILDADDSNFVDEYTITYAQQNALDTTGDELETFISEISAVLQANNGLDVYKKDSFHGRLVLFDFKSHLYAPLICLEKSNLKIQVSPVALNMDEMLFVDHLKTYVETHSSELEGKSLYLLRNKSKVGMGFFEAGNFYPDYILWIDTEDKQYISFIDPKGLLHIRSDDPKVEFYKTIKELETRLAPTADGKTVVLNSFIMSGTPASQLRQWWLMERPQREEKNVYTLDNPECVELMIDKILRN